MIYRKFKLDVTRLLYSVYSKWRCHIGFDPGSGRALPCVVSVTCVQSLSAHSLARCFFPYHSSDSGGINSTSRAWNILSNPWYFPIQEILCDNLALQIRRSYYFILQIFAFESLGGGLKGSSGLLVKGFFTTFGSAWVSTWWCVARIPGSREIWCSRFSLLASVELQKNRLLFQIFVSSLGGLNEIKSVWPRERVWLSFGPEKDHESKQS